ncbi:hypothetical protein IV102_18160 [bacterium]|nr:hypothetical protein [bacterium]
MGAYLKTLLGWQDRCKALTPPPQLELLVNLLAEAGEASLSCNSQHVAGGFQGPG